MLPGADSLRWIPVLKVLTRRSLPRGAPSLPAPQRVLQATANAEATTEKLLKSPSVKIMQVLLEAVAACGSRVARAHRGGVAWPGRRGDTAGGRREGRGALECLKTRADVFPQSQRGAYARTHAPPPP